MLEEWNLIYMDPPFLLVVFLSVRVGKDRRGSPLFGGMLITRITRPFGILNNYEAVFSTVES